MQRVLIHLIIGVGLTQHIVGQDAFPHEGAGTRQSQTLMKRVIYLARGQFHVKFFLLRVLLMECFSLPFS